MCNDHLYIIICEVHDYCILCLVLGVLYIFWILILCYICCRFLLLVSLSLAFNPVYVFFKLHRKFYSFFSFWSFMLVFAKNQLLVLFLNRNEWYRVKVSTWGHIIWEGGHLNDYLLSCALEQKLWVS